MFLKGQSFCLQEDIQVEQETYSSIQKCNQTFGFGSKFMFGAKTIDLYLKCTTHFGPILLSHAAIFFLMGLKIVHLPSEILKFGRCSYPKYIFFIKNVTLISDEGPYFSHNSCEILGLRDVSFRIYEQNSSELQRKVVYHHSCCSSIGISKMEFCL